VPITVKESAAAKIKQMAVRLQRISCSAATLRKHKLAIQHVRIGRMAQERLFLSMPSIKEAMTEAAVDTSGGLSPVSQQPPPDEDYLI
jgi:hypothetical protein